MTKFICLCCSQGLCDELCQICTEKYPSYDVFLKSGYAKRSTLEADYNLWFEKKGRWLAPECR